MPSPVFNWDSGPLGQLYNNVLNSISTCLVESASESFLGTLNTVLLLNLYITSSLIVSTTVSYGLVCGDLFEEDLAGYTCVT